MKKSKTQVDKSSCNPKWISPEKRMKHYKHDYGIDGHVPENDKRWKKVKWIQFRIVVPDNETKKELEAACEYLHDNRLIDTDYLAVNALVHAYNSPDSIVVDPSAFISII